MCSKNQIPIFNDSLGNDCYERYQEGETRE